MFSNLALPNRILYSINIPKHHAGRPWKEAGKRLPETKKACSDSTPENMLNHGLKQSNRLIIDRPELAEWYIMHNIITRVKNGQDIQEVWLREKDGSLKRLYVKESEE